MRLGLAVVALLAVAACGGGETEPESAQPSASPTTSAGADYFAYMEEKGLEPVEGVAEADIAKTAAEICRWARGGGSLDRIGEPGVLDVPDYLSEREIRQIGFGAVRGECPDVNESIIDEQNAAESD